MTTQSLTLNTPFFNIYIYVSTYNKRWCILQMKVFTFPRNKTHTHTEKDTGELKSSPRSQKKTAIIKRMPVVPSIGIIFKRAITTPQQTGLNYVLC